MKSFVKKTIYRSNKNKILTGFIGGIGEYFDIDPVILRVAYILVTAFTGFFPGIIAYFVASLIVPER